MHVDLIHWLRFCLFSLQVIWETQISGMMTFTQVIYFRTLKPYNSGCLVKKRYTLVNIWTTFRNQVVRHHRRRQSNLTNHSGNHESLVQWLIWAVCLYRLRAQVDFRPTGYKVWRILCCIVTSPRMFWGLTGLLYWYLISRRNCSNWGPKIAVWIVSVS